MRAGGRRVGRIGSPSISGTSGGPIRKRQTIVISVVGSARSTRKCGGMAEGSLKDGIIMQTFRFHVNVVL